MFMERVFGGLPVASTPVTINQRHGALPVLQKAINSKEEGVFTSKDVNHIFARVVIEDHAGISDLVNATKSPVSVMNQAEVSSRNTFKCYHANAKKKCVLYAMTHGTTGFDESVSRGEFVMSSLKERNAFYVPDSSGKRGAADVYGLARNDDDTVDLNKAAGEPIERKSLGRKTPLLTVIEQVGVPHCNKVVVQTHASTNKLKEAL